MKMKDGEGEEGEGEEGEATGDATEEKSEEK